MGDIAGAGFFTPPPPPTHTCAHVRPAHSHAISPQVPLGALEKKVKALEPSVGTIDPHDINMLVDELR